MLKNTACDDGTYGKACSVIFPHFADFVWCLLISYIMFLVLQYVMMVHMARLALSSVVTVLIMSPVIKLMAHVHLAAKRAGKTANVVSGSSCYSK